MSELKNDSSLKPSPRGWGKNYKDKVGKLH